MRKVETPLLLEIKKELDEQLSSLRKSVGSKEVNETEIINLDSDDDSVPPPSKSASVLFEEVNAEPRAVVIQKVARKSPITPAASPTSSMPQITEKLVAVNSSPVVEELIEHQPLPIIRVFSRPLGDDLLTVHRNRVYVRLRDFCMVNGFRDYRYLLWPVPQDYATRIGYYEARKYFFSSQSAFVNKINNAYRRKFKEW